MNEKNHDNTMPGILIVDDSPENLRLLAGILKIEGYNIRPARDGKIALKSARSHVPDLILLDIMMLPPDGYEVCRQLKADELTQDIPVIFISALDEVFDKVRAFEVGGIDYITKPFHAEEVLARVKNHLIVCTLQKQLEKQNAQLQQEIAERQQAEKSLAKERNLLQTLIDTLPDYIYIKDLKSRFVLANKTSIRGLRFTARDELIGKTDFDLFPQDLAEQFYADEQAVITSGTSLISMEEKTIDLVKEEVIWFSTTKVPFRDSQGNITGLIGLSRDITEQKRFEEELRKAKEQAEVANRAKSTFLANMSHELRTPLNAILGFAQIMAHNQKLEQEDQENLKIISRAGDHLLTLINQVLDLSKIEAGCITLNAKDFDLYALLDDVIDLFRLKTVRKHLLLLFERSPNVPQYIRTDDIKLRQVLINLLSNAIKFTEAGKVELRITKSIPNSQFVILNFRIEDTGPGVAPEEIDTLFEAFVQTETGRQAQEGTGLGLPISRKFVRLMGGDITVNSKVGHGTVFKFQIQCELAGSSDNHQPLRLRSGQTSIVKRVVALEPGQPQYRILIVDAQPNNRQVLVKLLQPFDPSTGAGQGFDIREAANGQEAIDTWTQWRPHLIWMDLRMPVMGGYEAAKTIRNEELKIKNAERDSQSSISNSQFLIPHCKIIALSASGFEDERTVALTEGCDDFLRKPFREAEIFEMMRKHLDVRFMYEEKKQSTIDAVLTVEALAELPGELLENLEEAVTILDMETVAQIIEQIRQNNAPLADALQELAKQYRFDVLQELFEVIT